jgi:hypothetical protein
MPTIGCFVGEQNQIHSKANIIISNGKHELKARNAEDIWLLPLLMKLARGERIFGGLLLLINLNQSSTLYCDLIRYATTANRILCKAVESKEDNEYKKLLDASVLNLCELLHKIQLDLIVAQGYKILLDNTLDEETKLARIKNCIERFVTMKPGLSLAPIRLKKIIDLDFSDIPKDDLFMEGLQLCPEPNVYNFGKIVEYHNSYVANRTKDVAKHLASALNKAEALQKRGGTQNMVSDPVAHNIASFLVGAHIISNANTARQEHKSR